MTPPAQAYREIYLSQGHTALVDEGDCAYLSLFKWSVNKSYRSDHVYAVRDIRVDGRPRRLIMHRVILGLEYGDPRKGDHIKSGKTLDNRRANLRIATALQNAANSKLSACNTSGYRGVGRDLRIKTNQWFAYINNAGKKEFLGYFYTPDEAAKAHDRRSLELRGEFAALNFAIDMVTK